MQLGEVYFWTSTVYQWKHLLRANKYKNILLESLSYLCRNDKINVYGFVLMPNHIHLLWEMLKTNGKEMPHASFQKFTAHKIRKDLEAYHPKVLDLFYVNEKERAYRFWQHKPLAIHVQSKVVAEQKLEYIHTNPLQAAHWNLAAYPEEYQYSSACFYETESKEHSFLTDYRERF